MRILFPLFLSASLFAPAAFGFELSRETKLATVTFSFAERPQRDASRAARYWPTYDGPGPAPKRLRYPALLDITYSNRWGSYRFPSQLVSGIGGLVDLKTLADIRNRGLIVHDRDGWVIISLSGSDGASSYRVEWQLQPYMGWIIRFAHDGLLHGKMGTAEGPELLSGQAVVFVTQKPCALTRHWIEPPRRFS